MSSTALNMVGMALRAGRLEIGSEASGDACQYKKCRLLLVTRDAGERTQQRAGFLAEEGACLLAELPCSKEELGAALGRKSCVMAAVTDLGLAKAVAERLAEEDPEQYGGIVERLKIKAVRAAQRKEKKSGAARGNPAAGKPVQYKRKKRK